MVERELREAEIFESNINKATQAEAPRACVFHMVIMRLWIKTQIDPQSLSFSSW